MKMKEMFDDYEIMVKQPTKEFKELYKKERIVLSVAVYAILIGGSYILSNREIIGEKIKSKFNRIKKD